MGGATAGFALARAGMRVLFCERGKSLLRADSGLRGNFAETFFDRPEAPNATHREILKSAGRYSDEIELRSPSQCRTSIPFIGSGTGGSTAIYGAVLERFFPNDFSPRHSHPKATSSTLPEHWPIRYEELAPYYQIAEEMFRVRG